MRDKRVFYLPLYATYSANGELNTYNVLELTLDCDIDSNYVERNYTRDITKYKVVSLAAYSRFITIHAMVQKRIVTITRGSIARGSLEAALCSYFFGSASNLGGEYTAHVSSVVGFEATPYFNAEGALVQGNVNSIFMIGIHLDSYSTVEQVVTMLKAAYCVDVKGNVVRLSECPLPWIQFIFTRIAAGDPMLLCMTYGLSLLPGVKSQTDAQAPLPIYLHEACVDNKQQQAAQSLMLKPKNLQHWFAVRKTVKDEYYASKKDVVTYELENATQLPIGAEQLSLFNVVAPLCINPSVMSLELSGDIRAPIQFPQEMGYFSARIYTLYVPLGNLPKITRASRAEALATVFTLTISAIKPQAFVETMIVPDFAVEGKLYINCKSQPCKTLITPAIYDGIIDVSVDRPQFQLCSSGTPIKARKAVAKEHILRITPATEEISLDLTHEHMTYIYIAGTSSKGVAVNAKLGKYSCYEDTTYSCTTNLYKNGGDLTILMARDRVTADSATYIYGKFNCLNIDCSRVYSGTANNVMHRHYYVNADVNYIAIDSSILSQVVIHVKKGVVAQMLQRYNVDPNDTSGYTFGMLGKKIETASGGKHFEIHPRCSSYTLQQAQRMGALVEDL